MNEYKILTPKTYNYINKNYSFKEHKIEIDDEYLQIFSICKYGLELVLKDILIKYEYDIENNIIDLDQSNDNNNIYKYFKILNNLFIENIDKEEKLTIKNLIFNKEEINLIEFMNKIYKKILFQPNIDNKIFYSILGRNDIESYIKNGTLILEINLNISYKYTSSLDKAKKMLTNYNYLTNIKNKIIKDIYDKMNLETKIYIKLNNNYKDI